MKKLLALTAVVPMALAACGGGDHYGDLKNRLYTLENRMVKGLAAGTLNAENLGRDVSTDEEAITSCKLEVLDNYSFTDATAGKRYIVTEDKDRTHIDQPGADIEYIIDKANSSNLYSKDKLNTAATWTAVTDAAVIANIVSNIGHKYSCTMISNTLQHAQVAFLNDLEQKVGFLEAIDGQEHEYLSIDISLGSKLSIMFDKTTNLMTSFEVNGGTHTVSNDNVGPYKGKLIDVNTSTPPTDTLA